VILCDAGPLFALLDTRQGELHVRCKSLLPKLSAPLVTTWPSFTEAMYLAHRAGDLAMQRLLWRHVESGSLVLHEANAAEVTRMAVLMGRYSDTPMDLADASLVAAAEVLNVTRIFSLDSHFHIYRLNDVQAFEVVP
jgi:uncharacterized protein